jgi:hypothetical protein
VRVHYNLGCSDLLTKVDEMKIAIEAMCNQTTSTESYSPTKWISVTKTQFGHSTLQEAGTFSFTIPDVIPSTAREVLIYVAVNDGSESIRPNDDIKIFTQIKTTKYEKYLFMVSWRTTGGHANTNSDNMWFPMPPNRMVYVTVDVAHTVWLNARLLAIGYR